MAKKFPAPKEIPDAVGVTFRSRKDIIDIYNGKNTGKDVVNLAKSVKAWVEREATSKGWGQVLWPKAYPNPSLCSGAVFVKGKIVRHKGR